MLIMTLKYVMGLKTIHKGPPHPTQVDNNAYLKYWWQFQISKSELMFLKADAIEK